MSLARLLEQLVALGQVPNNVTPEIHRQKFFFRCKSKHADHRFVRFQELPVAVTSTNAVIQISRQGTIACLRPTQFLLRSISLVPQRLLCLSAMDGHREMADATYFNTVATALQDEFCDGFSFHEVDQEDDRNGLFKLAQNVQDLCSLPVRTRIFSQNKIKTLRMKPFGKLFRSQNNVGADRESNPP